MAIPRVSIGMPAYNSAATIADSIDSILGQSFADFELIVSDNASSDATVKIVTNYADRDSRVRLIRQPTNIGANGNYLAVVRQARGEYFKWASSNDWCAPTFLERCVAVLDADRDTVLANPRAKIYADTIDNANNYEFDFEATQASPADRCLSVFESLRLNNPLNGLIRREMLMKTRLVEHYPGADDVLIAHLALMGKITLTADRLFYRRMDAATATRLMDPMKVHLHHYPTPTAKSLFPIWRYHAAYFRFALTTPLSMAERLKVLSRLPRRVWWDRRFLAADVRGAMRFVAGTNDRAGRPS